MHSVFSPRFNPQGDRLVYFESITGWAHHTCAALKMVRCEHNTSKNVSMIVIILFQIEWDLKTVTTVVEIVRKPQSKLQ